MAIQLDKSIRKLRETANMLNSDPEVVFLKVQRRVGGASVVELRLEDLRTCISDMLEVINKEHDRQVSMFNNLGMTPPASDHS
jgi:hypothetical protein